MLNPYIQSLSQRLEARFSIDRLDMSMSTWIETNTRLNKKPFSFKGYEFQRAIADDMHPSLDCMKCSQVGLTETQIRKVLAFLMRTSGVRAIFTFPTQQMFKDNSRTRIQPTVEGSAVFNPEGSDSWKRSMDLFQFDQSFLHVTGATEGEATSKPADAIFNDEVDLTDPSMLALFRSRLQNSNYKINQRFGTPTHVGFGIDKSYSASDMREYLCQCHACRHWENIPDFTREYIHIPGLPDEIEDLSHIDQKMVEALDFSQIYVKCKRCGAPLDLDNVEMRAWVPLMPSRSDVSHGYRVRPFVTSKPSPKYIITELLEYKRRDFVRGWHNTVLGTPFTDGSARLTEAEIKANMQSPAVLPLADGDDVYVGIDLGTLCHVVIAKPTPQGLPIAEFLTVPADDLETWATDLCERYNVVSGSCDRLPYTPTANALFEISKGRIFPVQYTGNKEMNGIENEFKEITYFQANRTMMIDAVVKKVRRRKFPMFGYGHFESLIIEHFRDMVRDENPEKEAIWIKLTGQDHYFHAAAFLNFSTKIREFISLQDDSEQRTVVSVLGVDMKQNGDVLSGTSKRSSDNLLGGRPRPRGRW